MNCTKTTLVFLTFCVPISVNAQPPTDSPTDIAEMVQEYSADSQTLDHRFRIPLDEEAFKVRQLVTQLCLDRLESTDFDSLPRDGQLDYLLLKNKLEYLLVRRELDRQRDSRAASEFLPFTDELIAFCRNREGVVQIDSSKVAGDLDSIATSVEGQTKRFSADAEHTLETRIDALRAADLLKSFQARVAEAHAFYSGYDPSYSWWCKKPMERLDSAMSGYTTCLSDHVVGVPKSDKDTIVGLPIGADGIELELKHEWIAHTPEELIELAEREMKWCNEQGRLAARALDCGDDWHKALELIKAKHVEPGKQPEMIHHLALEAIDFLRQRDLLTIPPLAASGWRMTMMSPEQQRVSPYFLGGDTIIVSYPTDTMTHAEKLMSMKSNNEHFSRATVHHELIPGHAMQYYALARYRPYRQIFSTPFWIEGWALYWEMLLWDLDFARGPEDRVGMLFWRKHRCARIVFSLNYHLGKMTPEQCVQYLVEHVGHERSAAAAEVRRSIMGDYGPMYQAAYMLGGLQLRKLHGELVDSGRMSNKEFHDAILKEHSIPIELLREYMSGKRLRFDAKPKWRFADE